MRRYLKEAVSGSCRAGSESWRIRIPADGVMKPTTYRSFGALKTLLRSSKTNEAVSAAKSTPQPVRVSAAVSDNDLFEQSMQDVTPLGWSSIASSRSVPIEIPNPQESEDE